MNRTIVGIIGILLILSCNSGKPVKIPVIDLPNGDTIQISGHLQKFYSFSATSRIYLGPDKRLLMDSIDMATIFWVDTVKSRIYSKKERDFFYVGKYFKNNVWKKGYVQEDDLTIEYYIHPKDTAQLFLFGFEEIDTNFHYYCELRAFENKVIKSRYRFGNPYYDEMEQGGTFKRLDFLGDGNELFFHVNFEWAACGFMTENYLFRYTDHFDSLLYYSTSGVELVNEGEYVYVPTNKREGLYALSDGKLLNMEYDEDITRFVDHFPLFIKRSYGENFTEHLTEENRDYTVKEYALYDLIYSFQNNKLVLLDSVNYDSTKFRTFLPEWADEVY